jgi:chemotaxis protein methyltransferase CheR
MMKPSLARTYLAEISQLIEAKLGLYFPESRWPELERGLHSAAAAAGFDSATAYCQVLLTSPLTRNRCEELATHLTIGETYFFREKPTFKALQEHILPDLIRARRTMGKQLRIWSAGACTGEEAYSLAILINELLPNHNEWSVNIHATDLNPHFLHKAREALYGEWSFRGVEPAIKQRYFTPEGHGRYRLLPSIRRQVQFSLLNLAEDTYPSPQTNTTSMDLILCRNVLMYFSAEQAKRVVRRLYSSLVEGGWLIVSLGEASHRLFTDFEIVQFPNAILYRKVSQQPKLSATAPNAIEATELRPELGVHQGRAARPYLLSTTQPISPLQEPRIPKTNSAPVSPLTQQTSQPVSAASIEHSPTRDAAKADVPPLDSVTLVEQARYAEAEALVKIELEDKPEDATALILLARICANQRRLDEALEWCNRALRSDRLNASAYYLCATIHDERGESHEAMQALKRALYLHPEFVLAHFALGNLAQRQGKTHEAKKHFANMLASLRNYQPDELVPESGGLTAAQLAQMVQHPLSSTSPSVTSSRTQTRAVTAETMR